MRYRPEIDGLRAVAVIPVILFHAGFTLFSGGFVGVDIFFVISGYLITTILIEDIENNRFSILKFYEKRARRILPALFCVMIACIPFAWMWMLPHQMRQFSNSLIAVSLFISNILFRRENGYFSAASDQKPLLHTWSLSVEEQYYLFIPIFLFLFWRFRKDRIFLIIVALTAISFTLSELGSVRDPVGNFYLAHTRAWELLAGSIAAFLVQKHGVKENNTLSLLGICAIFFSIFSYTEETPFPSVYTLVPVAGVFALILFAGRETFTAKILSEKSLVGIGLVSYSAYLWHQPLFSFARLFLNGNQSFYIMVLMCLITALISFISWKFIEKPFRNRDFISSKLLLTLSVIGVSAFIIVGFCGRIADGFQSRISISADEPFPALTAAAVKEWEFNGEPKHPEMKYYSDQLNRFGSGKESIVLVGDSHAVQYGDAFGALRHKNATLLDEKSIFVGNLKFPPTIMDLDLPENTTTVALSYFWNLNYKSSYINTYIRCCGKGPNGVAGITYEPASNVEMDIIDNHIRQFITELMRKKIRVIIILDSPFGEEFNPQSIVDLNRSFNISVMSNPLLRKEVPLDIMLNRSEPARSRLIAIAHEFNLKVIDPLAYLCNSKACRKFSDKGFIMYKDYDHLSLRAIMSEADYIYGILKY
jgi:peptidoglycan/LPS O-acetylase OafA/YrhL